MSASDFSVNIKSPFRGKRIFLGHGNLFRKNTELQIKRSDFVEMKRNSNLVKQ